MENATVRTNHNWKPTHQFVKWRTVGGWLDQKVKVVLFYAETKSVVETQRLFVHAMVQGGLLENRQFTDFANNLKLMVLCWRRSGRFPPVSVHLQSCDECKSSFVRGYEAKWWSHWTCSSWENIFHPMRINSVPDVKSFWKNKSVLCVQSMVWHFVRHPVYIWLFLERYHFIAVRFLREAVVGMHCIVMVSVCWWFT
jgi:hypothetical protein